VAAKRQADAQADIQKTRAEYEAQEKGELQRSADALGIKFNRLRFEAN
jgi:hypothetical protein